MSSSKIDPSAHGTPPVQFTNNPELLPKDPNFNDEKRNKTVDVFARLSSSWQVVKKTFSGSMKNGGILENTIGKVKHLFKGSSKIQPFGNDVKPINYVKADGKEIARFIKEAFILREGEEDEYAAREETFTHDDRITHEPITSNRGRSVVNSIFASQGKHYETFIKLFQASEELNQSGYPEGNQILNALKEKIESIPEQKRSRQLRNLLGKIEYGLSINQIVISVRKGSNPKDIVDEVLSSQKNRDEKFMQLYEAARILKRMSKPHKDHGNTILEQLRLSMEKIPIEERDDHFADLIRKITFESRMFS